MAKGKIMIHENYDTLVKQVIPNYEGLMQIIAEQIKPSHKAVLEIGICTGNLARKILFQNPTLDYTGIDIEPAYLEVARRKLGKNVELINGDILTDPIAPRYDVVVSSLTTHHFSPDSLTFLYEKISSSLNPEGIFVNLEIVKGNTPEEIKELEKRWKDSMLNQGIEEKMADEIIKGDSEITAKATILTNLRNAGFGKIQILYDQGNLFAYKIEAR